MKSSVLALLLVVFVSPCVVASVAITTRSVPNGTVKTAYSAAINASGGCAPYKWTIVSGALPTGVTAKVPSTTTSLNLAGTPTAAATYSFAMKVTGCRGEVSQVAYKVVIQGTRIGCRHHHEKSTQRHGQNTLFCGHQCQRRLRFLQVDNRIGSPASRRHREGAQHDDVAEPRRNADHGRDVLFRREGYRMRRDISQVAYKVAIQATANHVVDLNWSPSRSGNIVGYNLYRKTDAAISKKINVSLIASTLYSDSTVANSTTYYSRQRPSIQTAVKA